MNLRGYVYDDAGTPVSGATVEIYRYGESTPVASTTTGTDGSWVVTGLASGFQYRARAVFGGLARWIESRVELQVQTVVGPDGVTAPLPPQSVTTSHLQDGSVTGAKASSDLWAFKTVVVGGTSLVADQVGDTLTLSTQGEYLGTTANDSTDTASITGLVATPSTTNFPLQALTERSTTSTSMVLVKRFRVGVSGVANLYLDIMTSNNTYSATATVYYGGSSMTPALGSQSVSTTSTSYVTRSMTIPLIAGTEVLVYLQVANSAATAYIRNVRLGYTLVTAHGSVIND
jgi:hypothetical protein